MCSSLDLIGVEGLVGSAGASTLGKLADASTFGKSAGASTFGKSAGAASFAFSAGSSSFELPAGAESICALTSGAFCIRVFLSSCGAEILMRVTGACARPCCAIGCHAFCIPRCVFCLSTLFPIILLCLFFVSITQKCHRKNFVVMLYYRARLYIVMIIL